MLAPNTVCLQYTLNLDILFYYFYTYFELKVGAKMRSRAKRARVSLDQDVLHIAAVLHVELVSRIGITPSIRQPPTSTFCDILPVA